jgi:hypothetical protein
VHTRKRDIGNQEGGTVMSDKMIVLVCDLDDAIHGEINVLDGAEAAARFVETLLESGFERERIRVFVGDEMQMEVHHRPVVSILGTERASTEDAPATEVAPQESTPEQETATARSATLQSEEEAEPFVKNGVRFSTQFRAA